MSKEKGRWIRQDRPVVPQTDCRFLGAPNPIHNQIISLLLRGCPTRRPDSSRRLVRAVVPNREEFGTAFVVFSSFLLFFVPSTRQGRDRGGGRRRLPPFYMPSTPPTSRSLGHTKTGSGPRSAVDVKMDRQEWPSSSPWPLPLTGDWCPECLLRSTRGWCRERTPGPSKGRPINIFSFYKYRKWYIFYKTIILIIKMWCWENVHISINKYSYTPKLIFISHKVVSI
jgi:hypothetical protein